MASARVGSPIRSCQRSTGIWRDQRGAAAVAVLDDFQHKTGKKPVNFIKHHLGEG